MEQNPSWKAIVSQLPKKSPAFYKTQKFMTMLKTAHNWTPS
jgi:hypothetical protein